MGVIVAVISMVITGGAVWYGTLALTGNSSAGYAFGLAFGLFVYQVVFGLYEINNKK